MLQSQWQGFMQSVGSIEVVNEATNQLVMNREIPKKKEISGLDDKIELWNKYFFTNKSIANKLYENNFNKILN